LACLIGSLIALIASLIERTICNLQLAEDAVEAQPPDGRRAKERAAEALETARRALATAPDDAAAHIWYGQAVGTHAKVFDPGLGLGRVCNVLVQHWDRAVELKLYRTEDIVSKNINP
jgi:hypothetical protein